MKSLATHTFGAGLIWASVAPHSQKPTFNRAEKNERVASSLNKTVLNPNLTQIFLGRDEYPDIDESLLFRRQQLKRLILANLGFLTAMGLVIPIVYFEEDLQRVIQDILCSLINE